MDLDGDLGMPHLSDRALSDRQRREREYYQEYYRRQNSIEVLFDPVLGIERRPWNSYWYLYEIALRNFRNPQQRLLDFGCGSGAASIRFAKIGYEVWGFDISPANVSRAEARATRYGYEARVHFSVQTAEKLEYQNDFFDILTGIDILHHVEIERAILESLRVLKNGGLALFREHIEAPIYDRIRNTMLGKRLFPKDPSFDRHITTDERKLTARDIETIRSIFRNTEVRRFELTSRLDYIFRKPSDEKPSVLEKMDARVLTAFPGLAIFGGAIVLQLSKPAIPTP